METESLPPPPVPLVPQTLLSPGDLPADEDGRLRFWKPTYWNIAKSQGWRWLHLLYLIPGIIFIILGSLSSRGFWPWVGNVWMWASCGFAVTAGIADAIWQAIQKRKDLYCIHCGYSLVGLPEQHVCPECGRRYSFELIRMYQQDPKSFVKSWKAEHAKRDNSHRQHSQVDSSGQQ